ncbi:MAG: thioredoxin family protein [Candidatus Omnitrophota bacterium]
MVRVDILIQPSQDCSQTEKAIRVASKIANVPVQVNKTSKFAEYAHCAINPSQTPIIIISGHVEFAGRTPEVDIVAKKLVEYNRQSNPNF